jgi:PilZ domain
MERREFFRVLTQIPMSCMAVDEHGDASLLRVRSVDLSGRGVSLVADAGLDVGRRVRLSFQAGDPAQPVRVDAVVVRIDSRPGGAAVYGLDFPGLDPELEQRIVRAAYQEPAEPAPTGSRRMNLWQPVECRTESGADLHAHATAVSADEVSIATRHPLAVGHRVGLSLPGEGPRAALAAWATVSEVADDGRGNVAATLLLDHVDRAARAAVLNGLAEAERRQLAGE